MTSDDPVLEALVAELERTLALGVRAPYHLVLRATEDRTEALAARHGALEDPRESHRRSLTVDARFGAHALDSTHPLRDDYFDPTAYACGDLPVEDDPRALRRAAWAVVEPALREAEERFLRVRADRAVKVGETDPSPDLSEETPCTALHPGRAPALDRARWAPRLVALSHRLDDRALEYTHVALTADARTTWVVDGDGTRVRHTTTAVRIDLFASTTAPDGARVGLTRWKIVHDPTDLPDDDVLTAWADELRDEVTRLAAVPPGEPASGPVILDGQAAAVWLHEVFGHRAEGHRQKDETEGQTFRGCVGRAILPPSVSIWDDPTVRRLAGEDLAGHYLHDDEGRPAERAHVVRDGVFTGFLMGRSPIQGFPRSNGHGRAMPGMRPVSRMGNTVLETTAPVPRTALRERLIALARRQGRPWGLVVDRLSGGFTLTGRSFPNAFSLEADRAWRVWTDGRPDDLVRGLDVVGTPLVALSGLAAAGDDPAVFNGTCGAESGLVAVAAVSPSLLFAELEVQRKAQGQDRPPVLPPPEPSPDPLAAELERAMRLALPGVPGPHFVALTVGDLVQTEVEAVPGAIVSSRSEVERTLGVAVRVGTPAFDSANFGDPGNDGFLPVSLPPGDAPAALARGAWLGVDRAWKAAAANLAAKEAARRKRPAAVRAPDFAPGPAHTHHDPPPPPHDREAVEAIARWLAGPLGEHADLLDPSVEAFGMAGTHTVADTLGTRVTTAVVGLDVAASARVRAPDGTVAGDVVRWLVRGASDLPPAEAMQASVRALAARLLAWRDATPATEEWMGPVLVTGEAAVGLFRWLLLPSLCATPPREREDEVPSPGALPFRVGRRVLPPGWSVVDDPRAFPELPSMLDWDCEGVPAEGPLQLVLDGVVRGLLASRTPGVDAPRSNGRALGGPGELARAAPTQVAVAVESPVPEAELRALALEHAAEGGLDHVVEVRRLADPAVSDWEGGLPDPLVAVRVYTDGREVPVRGLAFSGLDRRALVGVLAGGPSTTRTVFWHNDPDEARCSIAGFAVTITAPALLLREAELVPDGAVPTRQPVLPPP